MSLATVGSPTLRMAHFSAGVAFGSFATWSANVQVLDSNGVAPWIYPRDSLTGIDDALPWISTATK